MAQQTDDHTFIERDMYHGRGSRQPVRRFLGSLVPALPLLVGGAGLVSGRIASGEPEAALFAVPFPGGSFLVFVNTLFGAAMCIGGAVLLVSAVAAFTADRATARRAVSGRRRPSP